MSNIEEIVNELLSIDSDISNHSMKLQHEQGEITSSMNKAQSAFGDQQACQELVATLYKTLQNNIVADSSLNLARQEIRDCIHNMQK